MAGNLIDGRAIAAQIQGEIAQRVATLKSRGIQPGLAFVRVGEDPASKVYVGRHLEPELLALLAKLNSDPRVHGILVQAPLPKQIREAVVYSTVLPQKDVD